MVFAKSALDQADAGLGELVVVFPQRGGEADGGDLGGFAFTSSASASSVAIAPFSRLVMRWVGSVSLAIISALYSLRMPVICRV